MPFPLLAPLLYDAARSAIPIPCLDISDRKSFFFTFPLQYAANSRHIICFDPSVMSFPSVSIFSLALIISYGNPPHNAEFLNT